MEKHNRNGRFLTGKIVCIVIFVVVDVFLNKQSDGIKNYFLNWKHPREQRVCCVGSPPARWDFLDSNKKSRQIWI